MGDAELLGAGVGDAQLRATVCGNVARTSDHAGLLGGLSGDNDGDLGRGLLALGRKRRRSGLRPISGQFPPLLLEQTRMRDPGRSGSRVTFGPRVQS